MPSECCGIWLESAASRASLGIKHLSALSMETTQIYLHANLQLKERAMDQTKPVEVPVGRYQPNADVMAFLEPL